MVAGLPSIPQSRFPNDHPPTLFHPASPKMKPAKPAKEVDDGASMMSTSTFASTVSLLKEKAKRALPISSRDSRSHKDTKDSEKLQAPKTSKKSLPKDSKTRRWLPQPDPEARARTAEAYMIWATTR